MHPKYDIFTYPNEIASRFNSYFVNIGPDLDLIMNTSAVYQFIHSF